MLILEGMGTPWGAAQVCSQLGERVWLIDTASHGGLRIERVAARAIPAAVGRTFMHGRVWAEEDCELPIALAFLMTAGEIDEARWGAVYPSVSMEKVWEYAHITAQQYDTYAAAIEPLRDAARRWRPARSSQTGTTTSA